MTNGIGSAVTRKVMERLAAPGVAPPRDGLRAGALMDAAPAGAPLRAVNAAAELMERGGLTQYPVVSVYCEKVVNDLREKFRSFSGTVQMAIEVRHSQDRLDGIEEALEAQTDAVTLALSASRGDWGDGAYYAGGYQVSFGRTTRGGKNFSQAAKVTFEIAVSRS
jgi:hypothetical protein